MTLSQSAEKSPKPGLGMVGLTLVVSAVAASVTIAGPNTPCAEFIPGQLLCQLPEEFVATMQLQCIGQIVLLNTMPVFVALLAAASSRWNSGTHLLVIAVLGAAAGVSVAFFRPWPSLENLRTDSPVHLLGAPVMTGALVLAALAVERLCQLTTRCSRRGISPEKVDIST